jgi:hypothetical protein
MFKMLIIKLLDFMNPHRKNRIALVLQMLLVSAGAVHALQVTNYNSTNNDRFVSGFATNPLANISTNFVGAGYDWTGVAWSTTTHAASSFKGLGMLSPQHFLTAQHYEYTNNSERTTGVRLISESGAVVSQPVAAVTNLGYGVIVVNYGNTNYDLALGRLSNQITQPDHIFRMGVLDLYATSSSSNVAVYNNLPLLVYGRGPTSNSSPRVGEAVVALSTNLNGNPQQTTLLVNKSSVQLEAGDSGSPLMHGWTNANGGKELTVIGLNTGVNTDWNFMSLLAVPGAMANANTAMTKDGFALRVVGNSAAAWQGGSGNSSQQIQLNRAQNWSGGSVPSDLYVRFQGDQTTFRNITVNAATTLRGLYFTTTGNATNGFTFSGANTLTIGRGGIVNYDIARQTFTANLLLGDHQYWDGGVGGITISNLNSNGKLLEVAGAGTNRITGNMSGSGGLAVSGGKVEVTGTNSYTGRTWVHAGQLSVNGRIDSSSGVSVGTYGSLAGSGRVAAISGSGSIDPGNSPGILTAPSVDPTGGLDFNFEFTGLNPVYSDALNSVNDLLRLTAATPFSASLGSINSVNIYFSFTSLNLGGIYTGGFFTDQAGDFLATIDQAAFNYYVVTAGSGTVTYNGVNYVDYTGYDIEITTVAQTADFAGGAVNGRVTQFKVVPEPSTYALLAVGAGLFALVRWRRRQPQSIKD